MSEQSIFLEHFLLDIDTWKYLFELFNIMAGTQSYGEIWREIGCDLIWVISMKTKKNI